MDVCVVCFAYIFLVHVFWLFLNLQFMLWLKAEIKQILSLGRFVSRVEEVLNDWKLIGSSAGRASPEKVNPRFYWPLTFPLFLPIYIYLLYVALMITWTWFVNYFPRVFFSIMRHLPLKTSNDCATNPTIKTTVKYNIQPYVTVTTQNQNAKALWRPWKYQLIK